MTDELLTLPAAVLLGSMMIATSVIVFAISFYASNRLQAESWRDFCNEDDSHPGYSPCDDPTCEECYGTENTEGEEWKSGGLYDE